MKKWRTATHTDRADTGTKGGISQIPPLYTRSYYGCGRAGWVEGVAGVIVVASAADGTDGGGGGS